ncbi:hypothetical protein R1sor_000189 [Riccia sorocarpa]|uniref:Uncharacterized protein n=1 Tax=Riccia sorocarpa TaxID=122646 RepID=A0ABD3GUS1_9MARC
MLEQAKQYEPSPEHEGIHTVFMKLKKKKIEEEERAARKTPSANNATANQTPANDTPHESERQEPSSARGKAPKRDKAKIRENEPVIPVAAAAIPAANLREPGDTPHHQGDHVPTGSAQDQSDQVPDERNHKRKKKAETNDFSNGEFRNDLFFSMERRWVPIKSSLPQTIEALRMKKQAGSRGKSAPPAIEELNSMCFCLKSVGRTRKPFVIDGKKSEKGADLIMLKYHLAER